MDIYEISEALAAVETVDAQLDFNTVDTAVYGNNFDGTTDSDGILTFEVESGGRGLVIEFDTYDIDYAGEVAVIVNGVFVGVAADGTNNGAGEGRVTVDEEIVVDGVNTIQFVTDWGTDNTWGITNIDVSPESTLVVGEVETGEHGARYGGALDTDGSVSFQFFPDTIEDLTLYVQGYDIDYYGEVEVFLNGESIGYLEPGENGETTGSSFEIAAEQLNPNSNVLEFRVNGIPIRAWGVTDVILMGSGGTVSEMAIDPEFTDDGWVTWQEGDQIFIGTYDPNSGALVEVLNESIGGALPFSVTYYGSEFVMTADGPVALGISEEGIIYLDENDSYILEGTEGFRVGFLPKGDYDGLRFTMVPLDYWIYDGGVAEVYLWDNGEITLLDFGDPTTRAVTWLNGSEVVIFSDTQMGVYNVDTEEVTWITEDIYQEGYVAAIETTDGEKYISILADDGYTDIWMETDDGWELWRRLVIPEEVYGEYLYSPEFQEQDGKLYLMGISSELPTTNDLSAIVIYDLEEDTWSQVSEPQYAFDPEIVPLEDGGFSLYYRNRDDGTTEWFNVTMAEVEALAVPGVETTVTTARVSVDTTMSASQPVAWSLSGAAISAVGELGSSMERWSYPVERMAGSLGPVGDGSRDAGDPIMKGDTDVFEFATERPALNEGTEEDLLILRFDGPGQSVLSRL